MVDSATETFYYNTSTTDSISDGALTSMALFSNEWIYYRYDSLSRLKERDVGGILTEHQTTCFSQPPPMASDAPKLSLRPARKRKGVPYDANSPVSSAAFLQE